MRTPLHELEDVIESFEVELLGGSEWMFSEERNDDPDQFAATLHEKRSNEDR